MSAQTGSIVVGYDGGADAVAALDWAIRTARLEDRPLRVVVVESAMDPVLASDFHERAERLADEWRARAAGVLATAHLEQASVEVPRGPALGVLLRTVTVDDLLVVGSRGHAPLFEALGGSVSQHLPRRATCPVAVVRPAQPDARGIVVGVDGSPKSLSALRFACIRARLTGEDVAVLHGHRARWPQRSAREVAPTARLHDWVGPLRAECADVGIVEMVLDGSPSDLLVDRSRTASLLVLGNRGRDALVDLVLGSTSQDVLHRACCPVVIVR